MAKKSRQSKSTKWTRKKCLLAAQNFSSRTDFKNKMPGAYKFALRNNILENACSHMDSPTKPNGYWTKARCIAEGQKYTRKIDFKRSSPRAYSLVWQNGWHQAFKNIRSTRKPKGYWTIKRAMAEARKFDSRSEFSKSAGQAHRVLSINGMLEKACDHMISTSQKQSDSRTKWTKDRCKEEAKKYRYLTEFIQNSAGAYHSSSRNGWLDEVTADLERKGSRLLRGIYIYEFNDKSVYVGLTYDYAHRYRAHHESEHSQVFKKIKTGIDFKYFEQGEYLPVEKAAKEERLWIEYYRNLGWKILNIGKAGILGGSHIRWTKDRCEAEALKYSKMGDFIKNSSGAYSASRKYGWLGDITRHFKSPVKSHGYWNKQNVLKEAMKYKKPSLFQKGSPSAYTAAKKRGWFEEITKHMEFGRRIKWTKVACEKIALRYSTRNKFKIGSPGAYNAARAKGFLDEICKHMTLVQVPHSYWNKLRCKNEASKYKSRTEFRKGSPGAYAVATTRGWVNSICSHMQLKGGAQKWSKEKCVRIARKYKRRIDFMQKDGGAYAACVRRKWLEEACSHMVPKMAPRNKGRTEYWTKERCALEAKKYNTRKRFSEESPGAYSKSRKQGWLDQICGHMMTRAQATAMSQTKWNLNTTRKEAKKYKSRVKFKFGSSGAYQAAIKHGWIDQICKHMK